MSMLYKVKNLEQMLPSWFKIMRYKELGLQQQDVSDILDNFPYSSSRYSAQKQYPGYPKQLEIH